MNNKTILTVLILCTTVKWASAQWSTDPANPTAVCDVSCPQSKVSQLLDGNGGTTVFWLDSRSGCDSGAINDIYAQHYDENGIASWEEDGRLMVDDSSTIGAYSVVNNPDGSMIIVWFNYTGGYAGLVKARKVDANGTPVWAQDLIMLQSDGCTGNYILGPSNVQVISSGTTYVVRTNVTYCGGSNGNRISRFDTAGNLLSPMSGAPEGNQYYNGNAGIDQTYDGSDDVYLFYTNGNGSGAHASAMRIGAEGDSVFAPIDVLEGTNGLNYQFWALSDESGLAVCFISDGSNGTATDIFLRKLNSDGTWAWGGSITTVCGAEGNQGSFDITQDDNYYYVCWADSRPGVVGYSALFAQKIDKVTGQTVWTEDGVLVQDVGSYLPKPSMVLTGDGNMILMNEASSPYYFNASLLLADGTLGWTEPVVVANAMPFYEDYSIINSNGNIITAWSRSASIGGTDNIYIARIVNVNTVNLTEQISACDSYTSNGETFTSTGTYVQQVGDTLLTIELTINNSYQSSFDATSCFEYVYEGITYTSSGTYVIEGLTAAGCDSTLTIEVTIEDVNTVVTSDGPTLTAEATNSDYSWIDCSDNSPVGVFDQTFTPTTNGSYAVNITTGDCSATSTCFDVIVEHVEESADINDLQVYPNPGSEMMNLVVNQFSPGDMIQIFDGQGKLIQAIQNLSGKTYTFNTSHLNSGIYNIVWSNELNIHQATWIKN